MIFGLNFFMQQPMEVYANATQEGLRKSFLMPLTKRYPGVPEIDAYDQTRTFQVGDIPVVPIKVWHLKMPVLGFRFGSFTYITDAIEEEVLSTTP